MKRQEEAAVLNKTLKAFCEQNSEIARQNLASKYEKVVLEVPSDDDDSDSEVRIVTDIFFADGTQGVKKGWYVRTDIACLAEECKHSDEKYEQEYSTTDIGARRDFRIASGSKKYPGLGTYIKLFNANENSRMALWAGCKSSTPVVDLVQILLFFVGSLKFYLFMNIIFIPL
jgi:hypothetical protein